MSDFWQEEDESRPTEIETERESLLDSVIDSTVAQIKRAEIEAKVGLAHKFPRKISGFMKAAEELACYSKEIAEQMYYSVPRGGKKITGPSIRMAEIAAMAWGNLDISTRILSGLDETDRRVVVEATVYDLENGGSVTSPVAVATVYSSGERAGTPYNEDMRNVTLMQALAKARRNAIFQVVPRPYVNLISEKARAIALGKEKGLDARRNEIFGGFKTLGERAGMKLTDKHICSIVGKNDPNDITWDDIGDLIGIGGAIREKETTLAEVLKESAEKSGANPLPLPTRTTKAKAPPVAAEGNGKPAAAQPAEKPPTEAAGEAQRESHPMTALRARAAACGIGDKEFSGLQECMEFLELQGEIEKREKEAVQV